jgi:hypothetical protein
MARRTVDAQSVDCQFVDLGARFSGATQTILFFVEFHT